MYRSILFLAFTVVFGNVNAAHAATFEDLSLPPNSFNNGDPGGLTPGQSHDGSFVSGGATFNNRFAVDADFGYSFWSGWSYSNITDNTTAGFGNQYSAFPGQGAGNSTNYAIASQTIVPPIVELPADTAPLSIGLTNTTYAALSMRAGDSFAKKFGGASGNDADWFLLKIIGLNEANQPIGNVDFYLADFRFADNASDYIIDDWTTVDLSGLSTASKLTFELSSSDSSVFSGETYMNTPAYFAVDNLQLVAVPEPGALMLLAVGVVGIALLHGVRRRIKYKVTQAHGLQSVGELSE